MAELRFVLSGKQRIPDEPVPSKIHFGRTKFSTHNTAVYPEYVLIERPDDILRLKTSCSKAYCCGNTIALLEGTHLRIFTDMRLKAEYDISEKLASVLNDLPPEEVLEKLVEAEKKEGNGIALIYGGREPCAIFCPGDKLLVVFKDTLELGGNTAANNTIHEDGCQYLLAWRGDKIVVGSTLSENFIYISGGQEAILEDCDGLGLRLNADFDPCLLEDMAFQSNKVLLKDSEYISSYEMYGEKEDEKEKSVVDCDLSASEITIFKKFGDPESGKEKSVAKESLDISEDTSTLPAEEKDRVPSKEEVKSVIISDDKAICLESKSVAEGRSRVDSGDIARKQDVSRAFDVGSLERSVESEATEDKEIRRAAIQKALQDEGTRKGKEGESAERLEQFFQDSIKSLRDLFSDIKTNSQKKVPHLMYKQFTCDFSRLYSRVYLNDAKNYEEIIDGLIYRAETFRKTLPANVEESMRYFDRRILGKGRVVGTVKYKDPLVAHFKRALGFLPEKEECCPDYIADPVLAHSYELPLYHYPHPGVPGERPHGTSTLAGARTGGFSIARSRDVHSGFSGSKEDVSFSKFQNPVSSQNSLWKGVSQSEKGQNSSLSGSLSVPKGLHSIQGSASAISSDQEKANGSGDTSGLNASFLRTSQTTPGGPNLLLTTNGQESSDARSAMPDPYSSPPQQSGSSLFQSPVLNQGEGKVAIPSLFPSQNYTGDQAQQNVAATLFSNGTVSGIFQAAPATNGEGKKDASDNDGSPSALSRFANSRRMFM